MSFFTGLWETEAPLSTETEQEHLKRLTDLMEATRPLVGIQIRFVEVWVDGVLWTWHNVKVAA